MSLNELSAQQKEKLQAFRQRVEHLLNEDQREDHFLIRWLLAREMDLDKAEEMLLKSLEWRKINKADGISQREIAPENMRKRLMYAHIGEDKDGFPILMLPCGRHEHKVFIEEHGLDEFLRLNILWIEKVMQIIENARKTTGQPVFQYHEIIDLEYYTIRQLSCKPAINYILQTQRQFDDNYPEILRTVTIINAPRVFPILFGFIKPLLSKQTMDKISVFGTDEEKWKAHFREKFPIEKFPPRWGGTRKGSDEFCSQEDVWVEFPIPLRYFKEIEGEDEEGFLSTKVAARDKFKIELEILEPNTKIEWKYQTELHDIAFGITFENPGEVNIPVERAPSQKSIQEGFALCKSKGKVIVIFDNKFSYTTAKNLRYKVDVIPPTSLPNGKVNPTES